MSESRITLGRNICAAREKMGWRQMDLARVIDAKSAETISQIEKGGREVKAWELSRIADALHVEFQELLSPQPLEFGPPPLWRKEAGATKQDTESRLRQRSQRYRKVMELTDSCPQKGLPSYDNFDVVAVSYARLETLSRTTGASLNLGERPADRLFEVLENTYGVMIFYQDLGQGGSAVSVRGPYGPAMLLNSREPPWRRNFSCAHELFHLLTWSSTPRERLNQDPALFETVEKHAEAFASGLLLPSASLSHALDHVSVSEQVDIAKLISIARQFGVSTSALLWRMKNLRMLTKQTTEQLLGDMTFQRADRSTMFEHWWTPPDLPSRFVELAFVAYREGKLSRARLAEMLEKDLADLPQLLSFYGLGMECEHVPEAKVAHP
jgi:Zn-dependent peptidase ImmA (M78 family)/transcriptional regulator with XRE-family HTH domain